MKKSKSKVACSDPLIVSRVKSYLAENVDKTYVDVSEMARCLKQRHSEYSNRNDSAFCKMVEGAYKIVLDTYGLKGASTSEGSDEEFDGENMAEKNNLLNQRLINLYNKPDKPSEPINILSSDEEDIGPTPTKLPKIGDQITITPHTISSTATPVAAKKSSKSQMDVSVASTSAVPISYATPKVIAVKKKFDVLATKTVKVSLADVGGVSDILEQIADLVLHMKHPEVYAKLGIKYPRGALLHGPPGTGKTLLAHAIAGKLELPLVAVSGTELVGGVSGESEERIRELFERASSIAPCILFIDEIDAICSNRANAQKDMEKRMVAQLLASLDALGEKDVNVLVLAATNNPDTLDPALRRAGRLEQEIALGIPTLTARKEILNILCKDLVLDDDVDFHKLAQITPGFVGADLQGLVNKASTHAVKRAFMLINGKKSVKVFKDCDKTQDKDVDLQKPPEVKVADDQLMETNNASAEADEKIANEKVQTDGEQVPNVEIQPSDNVATAELEIETEGKAKLDDQAAGDTPVDNAPINVAIVNDTIMSTENNDVEVKLKTPMNKVASVKDLLYLLEDNTPYSEEQLTGISINFEDFQKALQTTKPCAVREGIVTVPDVTWQNVGSLNEVRKDLQLAVLAPVKYPELLKKLGLSVPSGVLLCGPPGCGKTLLAKAVANEAGVNFISVKGPELLNMYVGESERAVRTCFRRARNSAPCVIFFDEFDSLCPRRAQHDNNGAARVVNQLLTEMDGIETREGVFVLAASNRPDIIDPAVLRPGRLDRVIYVGMPAVEDRVDILQKLTKRGTQPQLHGEVNLQAIAEQTDGYTGADLAGLVRSAATAALTHYISIAEAVSDEGTVVVTYENFKEALAKCRPSVSAQQLKHYEKLKLKYASTINNDMKMETENGEIMDILFS